MSKNNANIVLCNHCGSMDLDILNLPDNDFPKIICFSCDMTEDLTMLTIVNVRHNGLVQRSCKVVDISQKAENTIRPSPSTNNDTSSDLIYSVHCTIHNNNISYTITSTSDLYLLTSNICCNDVKTLINKDLINNKIDTNDLILCYHTPKPKEA